MSSSEPRGESPYGQPGRRHGSARDLSRAVAERERGRRRLTAATATVSFASVVGAGVVAAVLPGSTHSTVTAPGGSSASTGTGSSSSASGGSSASTGTGTSSPASGGSGNGTANLGSGSQNSGSSTSNGSDSSNSTGNSSNLQAPTYTPSQSSGGGQSTSGGSSPF